VLALFLLSTVPSFYLCDFSRHFKVVGLHFLAHCYGHQSLACSHIVTYNRVWYDRLLSPSPVNSPNEITELLT